MPNELLLTGPRKNQIDPYDERELGPGDVRADAIDSGLSEGDSGALNLAIGLFVTAAVVGYIAYRQVILGFGTVGEAFLRDMRNRVFAHLMRLSTDDAAAGRDGR